MKIFIADEAKLYYQKSQHTAAEICLWLENDLVLQQGSNPKTYYVNARTKKLNRAYYVCPEASDFAVFTVLQSLCEAKYLPYNFYKQILKNCKMILEGMESGDKCQ